MPAFPLFQLPVREQGLCRRQSFLEQGVLKGIMGSIVLNTRIHWKQDCSLEASSQIPRKLRAHLNINYWHMLPYGGRYGNLILGRPLGLDNEPRGVEAGSRSGFHVASYGGKHS